MTELDRQIQTMTEYIYPLAPEVRVEDTNIIYEDENANLDVYPPLTWDEKRCLDFQHQIADRVVDVLVESGYLILVHVYTPEEQIAKARRELALAQRQQAEANQFLVQAAALGMA